MHPIASAWQTPGNGRQQRLDELQTHEHTHNPAIQLACAEIVPNWQGSSYANGYAELPAARLVRGALWGN